MCVSRPAKKDSFHHAQADCQRPRRVYVSTLARADARMKRDWTLDYDRARSQCRIHEVGVELQVDVRIQVRQKTLQRVAAQHLVRRAHVRERPAAEMF